MPSRFDYVAYDATANLVQAEFKKNVQQLEHDVKGLGVNTKMRASILDEDRIATMERSKAKAIEALEVFYMWVGKSIRDEQILRAEQQLDIRLEEGRSNS